MPIAYLQDNPSNDRVIFFCPGCKCGHFVNVRLKNAAQGPLWSWDGSLESPTFTPSVLVRTSLPQGHGQPDIESGVCHSYVTNGQIQFLGDCTHELAGKTVPLSEF